MLLLYVLFVPVGLWLVTEAMWQHGAPFRYRVLALAGFLGVVAGVALGSGVVSGAGGLVFVIGQLLVTRYVRSGYYHGWTVRFGRKRARRARHSRPTETAVEEPGYDEYAYADHIGQQDAFGGAPVVDDAFAGYDADQQSGFGQEIPEAPSYAPAYAPGGVGYDPTPPEGFPAHDPAYGGGYATTPAAGYGQGVDGGYDAGYAMPYDHNAAPNSGAYETVAFEMPGQQSEFGAQPRPMSSEVNAAPIPMPTSPPPGWAAAPTAYNPDTGERLG